MIEVTERHLSEAYMAEMRLWLDPESSVKAVALARGEPEPGPMTEAQMQRWSDKIRQLQTDGTNDRSVQARARLQAAREAYEERLFKLTGGTRGHKTLKAVEHHMIRSLPTNTINRRGE